MPEAFAGAFEVALAFALDEGFGSKVTALTAAPEVALGSGAAGAASEVAFSTGAGTTLQEVSVHASFQPSSQVDHHPGGP